MNEDANRLGTYLKERRARLDPATFGFPPERRRTPGLRREEIAQIAHISATWYTWLEQGRGGAPSADVLDRLARAFSLSDAEREHLYLLAQDRPPKVRRADETGVTPHLQHVLDAFPESPALLKTPEWSVVAWNRAAAAAFVNYSELPPSERNVLRMIFSQRGRERNADWDDVAHLIVGTVRRDMLRSGRQPEDSAIIEALIRQSAEFRDMWADQTVLAHGEGVKRIRHPVAGLLQLEYSTFAVDGRADLSLVVFNPATPEDRSKIRELLRQEK